MKYVPKGIGFIESLKEDVNHPYLEKKEKNYLLKGIIIGAIVGGTGAIIGTECILDNFINKEILSWTTSAIANAGLFLIYYPLSPISWGIFAGQSIGSFLAYKSKLNKKKNLEDSLN